MYRPKGDLNLFQLMLASVVWILTILHTTTSLEISSWSLSNENGSVLIKNVTSPIDVYSALYQNSIIDWPLKGYNDVAYRWLAHDNWTFTSEPFSVPYGQETLLSLANLDVYPEVTLNGHFLNISSSAFSSTDIQIDLSMLYPTDNVLKLKFISPPLLAEQRSKSYKKDLPPDCWPKIFNGECHINFLRKTQSSFGWDWGPAVPTMGIRGRVVMHFAKMALATIKGVRFLTSSDDHCKEWRVEIIVKMRVLQTRQAPPICVKIRMENLQEEVIKCLQISDKQVYYVNWDFIVDSRQVKLWWPYEMGTPAAYKLVVEVTHAEVVLDRFLTYVGFRKVDLDQSPIEAHKGRHFKFNINCRPFFIKGTNWVPRSYLSSEWSDESYLKFLLESVKKANINTIRLWGGGRPETDLFYSIADRLGIMVWHDLMFAGSLYPVDPVFNNEIKDEITDLLWDIQRHPSILLWSGNNEVELLIAQGWYNTSKMDPQNIGNYYTTFAVLIKPLISKLDPYTPFVLSSPSNGVESERNKGVSTNPQSVFYGDVHFYLYSGDLWDEKSYPITRMTTEFGFQSYPSTNNWEQILTSEDDFQTNGTLANHRQHHQGGYTQIYDALSKYFGKIEPAGNNSPRDKYSWFSYLSQINQAMILKVHINRLRSHQCDITSTGVGYTSGAMFWQLNDNWIAPSWSTIEHNYQWKVAHHYVMDAFANKRIILVIQENNFIVRLILPQPVEASEYTINITCIDLSKNVSLAVTGMESIKVNSKSFPCNVATVLSLSLSSFLSSCKCIYAPKCLLMGSLLQNQTEVSRDNIMTVKPKDLHLPEGALFDQISYQIKTSDTDLSVCLITLKHKFVHLYVTFSTSSWGSFSKNGFHFWQETVNVTFYPWYHNQNSFFNCSNLKIEIKYLNPLLE